MNTWMNVYMQLSSLYFRPPGLKTREFEMPAYSPMEFIRAMQVGVAYLQRKERRNFQEQYSFILLTLISPISSGHGPLHSGHC